MPWLGVYVGKIPGATGNLQILLDHCVRFTMARVQRGSDTKDLFHYLVRAPSICAFNRSFAHNSRTRHAAQHTVQNNEDLPDKAAPLVQQLVDDGVLAIIAGADTTASALTMLIFCLLAHPDVYARLQAEVDRFYPPGEDPLATQHHREMPYLNACM